MITDTERIDWIERVKPRVRYIFFFDKSRMGFSVSFNLRSGLVPNGDEEECYFEDLKLRSVIDAAIMKMREFWSRQPEHLRPEKYRGLGDTIHSDAQ